MIYNRASIMILSKNNNNATKKSGNLHRPLDKSRPPSK